jgi:hypothetical protein
MSNMSAILLFTLSLIILTYLFRINRTIEVYVETLQKTTYQMSYYFTVTVIVNFAFVGFVYLYYGRFMKEFSSFTSALNSLILLVIQDTDIIDRMIAVSPTYTLALYILLVLISYLIMHDIFLSLIIYIYSEARSDYLADTKINPLDQIG